MNSKIILANISRFIFLIFFQVLILNNINFGGYINPGFYIYFILLLPVSTPNWSLLVLSFITGMTVDLFTNTLGLNAASSVLMAFARPFIIRFVSRGSDIIGDTPSLQKLGWKWFLYYSVILILIHHSALFYLEIFRFSEFLTTLFRVVLSSVFTLLLVMISEYLSYSVKK